MRNVITCFLIVTSILFGAPLFANEDPFIFGPEFTFSNELIHNDRWPSDISREEVRRFFHFPEASLTDFSSLDAHVLKLVDRMTQHLINGQPKGQKFTLKMVDELPQFTSPNGWSFLVFSDTGVIEITMSPMTVEQYKQYKDDIQDAIFVSAANEGLFPYDYLGGGHISLGLKAFENNPLLLRNFIVDFINHSELALGVLSYDSNNALPLPLLSPKTTRRFRQILHRYDYEGLWSGLSNEGIRKFLREVDNIIRSKPIDKYKLAWLENVTETSSRMKHHALNLSHGIRKVSADERRIEIRSVRPQKSMDVFVRQIELFRARLKFLEKIDQPTPLRIEVSISADQQPFGEHKLNPPVNAQEALKAFYRYVAESGLEWQDHTDYLWPQWIEEGEVEKFEQSEFFKAQEAKGPLASSCGELLEVTRP